MLINRLFSLIGRQAHPLRNLVMKTILFVSMLALALSACAQGATPVPATKQPPTTQALTSAPTASSGPLADANLTKPNDATQARLRVNQCVPDEPDMDVYMNGKAPVTADVPLSVAAGDVSRYEYLPPGTVSVAVALSGKGIDQAFLAPLDVTLEAGHRYTLVVLGQPDEPTHKSLLIDETDAYQKAGSNSNTSSHISVNNVKGAATLSFLQDGMGEKDVPYGGFAASVLPEKFKTFYLEFNGKAVEDNGSGTNWDGTDTFDCQFGTVSSWTSHTSSVMSGLNAIDFLQGLSAESARIGGVPSLKTFLGAIKTVGLTDLLTTGGPYMLFAPTDEAFAALPKDQLNSLLADPKALGDFLSAYIVEGYYPYGALGHGRIDRTVTNLLGKQLVLSGGDGLTINGVKMGVGDSIHSANGNRVFIIMKLIDPAAK